MPLSLLLQPILEQGKTSLVKQHVLRLSRFTAHFSRKKDIAKKEKVKLLL